MQGTLQSDGVTVQLEKKVGLSPGRVTVTVQTAPMQDRSGPTLVEVLDRIHHDQQQSGRKPMTEEEMAAEIAQWRTDDDEYEERCRQIWSQTDAQNQQSE
jgi:hypothetical protein